MLRLIIFAMAIFMTQPCVADECWVPVNRNCMSLTLSEDCPQNAGGNCVFEGQQCGEYAELEDRDFTTFGVPLTGAIGQQNKQPALIPVNCGNRLKCICFPIPGGPITISQGFDCDRFPGLNGIIGDIPQNTYEFSGPQCEGTGLPDPIADDPWSP